MWESNDVVVRKKSSSVENQRSYTAAAFNADSIDFLPFWNRIFHTRMTPSTRWYTFIFHVCHQQKRAHSGFSSHFHRFHGAAATTTNTKSFFYAFNFVFYGFPVALAKGWDSNRCDSWQFFHIDPSDFSCLFLFIHIPFLSFALGRILPRARINTSYDVCWRICANILIFSSARIHLNCINIDLLFGKAENDGFGVGKRGE